MNVYEVHKPIFFTFYDLYFAHTVTTFRILNSDFSGAPLATSGIV